MKIGLRNGHSIDKRLYNIWKHMYYRCYNPKNSAYEHYGAKGISVCDEWTSFVYFASWAIQNGYNTDLTIDRINPEGNYEPDNCRWVTMKVQANNKKKSIPIMINGTPKSFSVRLRNNKWEYRIDCGYENGKRKQYSRCGFNTKEDAIVSAKRAIQTKLVSTIK